MSKQTKTRIYLSPPHMSGKELSYINEAFDQNWIAPLGPNVDNFEKDLAAYCGVKHAAALSSGTAAIHLALIMLGVGPGDYVICQSFTFSATANPIIYQGATPVFIDSEPDTWNMDPDLLELAILDIINNKINENKDQTISKKSDFGTRDARREKQRIQLSESHLTSRVSRPDNLPKAIIPVHLYGTPANMDRILAVAAKYDIPVIEDAAEALGSSYKGRMAGSMGKMGVLSFNGNKIITTSGGGALLSDDEDLIKKARFLATQARDAAPHYQHSQIGYNYRMSNIVAGIGRGQMEVIDERVKKRRETYAWYRENLKDVKGISFPPDPGPDYFSNRWLTTILIDPLLAGFNREDLRQALENENIESRPLWKPMHLQPVFENAPAFLNGNAEQLFNTGLCLPSGSSMTDKERNKILDVISQIGE